MLTQKDLAEAIEKAGLSRESSDGRVSLQLKAATDTIVSPTGPSFVDNSVAVPSWTQVLRGLMPTIPVSGAGSVTHYTLHTTGNPTIVDEDGAKPQFSTSMGGETLPLVAVAGIEKVSEEAIEDSPQLIRSAEQLARATKDVAAIKEVFTGTGDIAGLMGRSSIATPSNVAGAAPNFSKLLAAINQVLSRGFTPNAIVMAAGNFNTILGKTLLSFEATYGTAGSTPQSTAAATVGTPLGFGLLSFERAFGGVRPHIAGIPVIVLPSGISSQWVLVGDFAAGAALYSTGERLEIGRDDDDFSRDRYSLRVVERMNVALRDNFAFAHFQSASI